MASPEVLQCPVCFEIYDDQNLCPRMLSCGHSFCSSCLERLLSVDDKIHCPTSRVEVNVSQAGVAGLPKNFALLSIFDVKPQQEEGESLFSCEVCDDKHPAIFWCFNCKEDMCKGAARFHTRCKATRDHQLISLESATSTEFCSKHSDPFRLFDEACSHVACSGCIKLHHQGHNCLSLAGAASKCRQEMQELATKVNARSEVIKTAEARVKQANLDMKKAYEEQEAQIHSLFREIYAAVTAREKLLTNELEQLYSSKANILTAQEDRLRKFQENVVTTVHNVLSCIHSSNDTELLVARSALEETLRDTEKHPVMLEPEVDFVAKLICDRRALQNLMDVALNEKVIVTENYTCAENTSAEGRRLRTSRSGCQSSFVIIAHDAQKRRRYLGGDLFMVELKDEFGNVKATGNVEDRGNGTYLATYTVPADAESGNYTLNVCLDGVHIHGSPFTVHVLWNDLFGLVRNS